MAAVEGCQINPGVVEVLLALGEWMHRFLRDLMGKAGSKTRPFVLG